MPNSEINVQVLENEYKQQFIDSLEKDMYLWIHGMETNNQAIGPGIDMLENYELYPHLTIEQIVRGTMNLTVAFENNKYSTIYKNVENDVFENYKEHHKAWMKYYIIDINNHCVSSEQLTKWAVPAIEKASNDVLYIMPNCLPNTAKLYMEYCHKLDRNFQQVTLPLDDKPDLTLIIVNFKIENNSEQDKELFRKTIANLQEKINFINVMELNKSPVIAIEVATELSNKLLRAGMDYTLTTVDRQKARETLIKTCKEAIDAAKPLLEKELGWGDYLTNLLKAICNIVIEKTNYITGSRYGLFTPVKAKFLSEIEEFNSDLDRYYN